jgi:hypothetical protein
LVSHLYRVLTHEVEAVPVHAWHATYAPGITDPTKKSILDSNLTWDRLAVLTSFATECSRCKRLPQSERDVQLGT